MRHSLIPRRTVRLAVASSLALGVMFLTGCQSPPAPSGRSAPAAAAEDAEPARVTVSLGNADGAAGTTGGLLASDAPVRVRATGGTLTEVTVTPDGGKDAVAVTGTWENDKRGWRSTRTMTPGATYRLRATAKNAAGLPTTREATFRVIPADRVNGVTVTPARDTVVGAGQPVSLAFDHPVKNKAAVERQLTVTAIPKAEGSWGWTKDPLTGVESVHWRPRTPWAKGTKVTLTARLSGVDTGDSRLLRRDVSTTFTTGTVRISKVDLKKHTMTVHEDGRPIRTLPISGGSPEYPTWNGTMVVLGKERLVRMTSASVNIADFYDKNVPWAVHLTTSGTYAHAAPWNEGKGVFGRSNTSHGCVGMSEADGKWFYDRAVRGDMVEVTGSTRRTVPTGNGFGGWNLSYDEWRELGALR
ncbi:Ig-like domain-containing protein [Streptomyces coeruleoprunus]|uniref:Ig-like domain-containing protein n=1 Tax=Streptomyces coeruleoprunus TaxID=285563 RepID=A0ABV9XIB3_9ACTN